MVIISNNYYLWLGLREVLKLYEESLQDITLAVSSDLKVIRVYKDIKLCPDEGLFFVRCLRGFVFSFPLNDDVPSLHRNLKVLTIARKTMYLTPREVEVTMHLLKGKKMSDVALMYGSSPKTISAQKRTAFKKLNVNSLHMLHKDISSFKSIYMGFLSDK